MSSLKQLLLSAALFSSAYAGLDPTSSSNIAVYWGQNSLGLSSGPMAQQPLAFYCDDPTIDVFQMSFVTFINGIGGVPEINFANQGNNCSTFDGTALLHCPMIANDIKYCQSKGKTILLSIGGATFSEGGFQSEESAISSANLIWDTFGAVPAGNSTLRPFDDAVIDGFDFDFESTVTNAAPFAMQLRTLTDSDTSKKYFFTAAPQCPFPDASDNEMFQSGVIFDAIYVQFYNNFCGVNSWVPGPTQDSFNFDVWDNWAQNGSANPDVKIFLGVPAGPGAAGTGFLPVDQLTPVIQFCKQFMSFGGVMMWDASQAEATSGFTQGVMSALAGGVSRIMRRGY